MESFDVLIIGSGPSGALSSYYLSKHGFKVGIIDKKDLGRDKICGGGLSRFAINELPYKLPGFVIERKIRGISFISPSLDIFHKKDQNIIGSTVYRSVFDSYLMEKSINANSTFYPNTDVKHITKENGKFIIERKYKSTYLIGADGANSIVKNLFHLGIKQDSKYVGMRAFIDLPEDEIDSHISDSESIDMYFKNGFRGYGWVFPLKEQLNIGVGILGKASINRHMVKDFALNSFKLPKKIIKNIKIEGSPIPVKKLPNHFSKENVFLIGDAAGLVDPVSGEGIHYAIRSGKIVADTILKDQDGFFKGKSDIQFKKTIERNILSDLFVSYRLRNFVDKFFLKNMDIWFEVMKRNPFVFNYIRELAFTSGYNRVYRDVLRNLPKTLVNTIKGNNFIPGLCIQKKLC